MLKCEKAVMDRLMLDAIKFNVIRYCDSNLNCSNRCFIKDLCDKYHAPNIHYLDDWNEKDIKEAYEILKVAEQEEW